MPRMSSRSSSSSGVNGKTKSARTSTEAHPRASSGGGIHKDNTARTSIGGSSSLGVTSGGEGKPARTSNECSSLSGICCVGL